MAKGGGVQKEKGPSTLSPIWWTWCFFLNTLNTITQKHTHTHTHIFVALVHHCSVLEAKYRHCCTTSPPQQHHFIFFLFFKILFLGELSFCFIYCKQAKWMFSEPKLIWDWTFYSACSSESVFSCTTDL